MRTDFQLYSVIALDRLQRGTVTTQIDGSANDGRFCLGTMKAQRHLFGIGTEQVQGLGRLEALLFSGC